MRRAQRPLGHFAGHRRLVFRIAALVSAGSQMLMARSAAAAIEASVNGLAAQRVLGRTRLQRRRADIGERDGDVARPRRPSSATDRRGRRGEIADLAFELGVAVAGPGAGTGMRIWVMISSGFISVS